jgi:predicted RNase H-like HicB family nuclease
VTAITDVLAGTPPGTHVSSLIETEREEDGRWIAEDTSMPGAMAYGETEADAVAAVKALVVTVTDEAFEAFVNDDDRPTAEQITFFLKVTRGV